MGKYMKKAKITGDVTVMEFSQSSHGVRTRAKTLALQRLQKTTLNPCETSYLQLRSRRLEKPQVPIDTRKQQEQQQEEGPKESCRKNLKPSTSSLVNAGSALSVSISCSKVVGEEDVGIEASFGESNLALEGRERTTRESTPCSLMRDSDTIACPGSSTRPTRSTATNRRVREVIQRNIPTTLEMEEFFALVEQQQQRLFTEKYNFDILTETPLPGRYDWVSVNP